jgi:hypothetical protein
LNPASEIKKCNYFRMEYLPGPFNKLFKFKNIREEVFWDPVFNNYDDIPSILKFIQILLVYTTPNLPQALKAAKRFIQIP